MKIIPFVLTGLLALAAAGRFHAEAEVRGQRVALSAVAEEKREVEADIERVRLEVEVLESAGRLSELNADHLTLRAVRAGQLVGDHEVAGVIGLKAPERPAVVPVDTDVIGNTIGMLDPTLLETGGRE